MKQNSAKVEPEYTNDGEGRSTYMASSKLREVVTSFCLDPRTQSLGHQRSTPNERSALRHHRVFGCGIQKLFEFCQRCERLRWGFAEHESGEGLDMKRGGA